MTLMAQTTTVEIKFDFTASFQVDHVCKSYHKLLDTYSDKMEISEDLTNVMD